MTFTPLRQPGFRLIWLVWLSANLTMWMNDVAAVWLMTSLTASPFMIALMQSASTLPLFLLGLPCGALADRIDRRLWLALTQVWMGAIAIVLAGLTFSGPLRADLLLACALLNGLGMAMRWPLFAAIAPDLVARDALPAALALNGIAANLARIIGPMVAGALLACAGGVGVYLLNSALSLVALILILRWQPAPKRKECAGERERLVTAMRMGWRYVMQSPPLHLILWRTFLFFLQTAALTALLPLVALRLDSASAAVYTSLLIAQAGGGVLMAFNLNRLRRHAIPDLIMAGGICTHAAASAIAALAPAMWLAVLAVGLAGMAWIATANALTVAMQLALPDWVRARGMAIYLMAVMGGSAAGAALWGYLASLSSVPASLLAAAALAVLVLLLSRRHRISAIDTAASLQ